MVLTVVCVCVRISHQMKQEGRAPVKLRHHLDLRSLQGVSNRPVQQKSTDYQTTSLKKESVRGKRRPLLPGKRQDRNPSIFYTGYIATRSAPSPLSPLPL